VRLRRGIKAWGKYLIEHLEVGGRAVWGARRRREKAARVGRRGGEDTADMRGLLDRETRERWLAWKARTKKENVFPAKTRPTRGLDGPAGTVLACGGGTAGGLAGPEAERPARLAGPKAREKRISELKLDF
jgi:hypothetical protein